MREIKFSYILQHQETGQITEIIWNYSEIFSGVAKDTLEREYKRWFVIAKRQFTGLLDKNGKEIWGGDIIKCYCKGLIEVAINAHEVKLPDFYREVWSSKVCDDGMWLPADIGEICGAVEVIGNIYSNPELLNNEPNN